jgi:Carboxypeptidase regulatory-like domain
MESAFRSTWTYFLLAFVVLSLCVGTFAQGGIGELTGQVTDTTGAVVSGVEVKLANTATGEVRTTTTTPAGTYNFPALPIVGSYTLSITNKGFKSVKVQNIIATVGQVTTRDVKLEVGAITEQVTVEAGAQLVQTEDSSLSTNVDRQVWTNMPLETRSQNEFIGLTVGAEPAANAELGTDRGAAVNGTRSGSGNFMVEGFDNNDQGLGGAGSLMGVGGANTTISPDAIEEYRVIADTPPAEYGKAGGFVTDTVLKGGTNQWHGSLFEYNRIQALAANSWFSNANGQQDHLIRNQFGGSVGGPIIKDKTFFYFTTEFQRLRTAQPLTANAFTQQFSDFVNSGAFETFQETDPGGVCEVDTAAFFGAPTPCPGALSASSTLGPVYQSMANQQHPALCDVTKANCTNPTNVAQGLYTGQVLGAPGITYPVPIYGTETVGQGEVVNQGRYTVKFDHKLGPKDQLNIAYLYDNVDANVPFAGSDSSLGVASISHGRAQNAGITWTHTLSPTVLNQARMSYVRHTANFPGDPAVGNMPSMVTFFDESTVAFGNSSGIPQLFTENEFIYKDDLSVTRGKHNFKFGGEYRRTRNGSSFDNAKNGLVLPMDVEDLVTDGTFGNQLEQFLWGGPLYGSIAYAEASLNPVTGALPVYYRGYRANEVAMYGQDDWRVSSRLTVNLGLRWEYFGTPQNFQPGVDANFYQGVPVTPIATTSTNPFFPVNSPYAALFATGSVQQRNHDLWNKDLNNFGPRLGFAYDVMGNQKLVVRGGFGINYDRLYNNIFENIRFNPPFFAVGLLGSIAGEATITPAQTAQIFTNPFTPAGTDTFFGNGLTPSLRAMDQNLVTPYYEQAHFGFQYQIAKDMVIESNYVGTFGHKLTDITGRNTFDGRTAGGDSTPLNPNYSSISFRTNCCDSNYSAWQTTLKKRFSGGLQLNANYTFSKAMDDVSDTFTTKNAGGAAYPTDSFDPKLDYGPADFNVKHRVVGNFVYDLPFAKSNRWLGGWNISGVVSVQTGANFSIINSTVDSNADTQFNDRAVYLGPGDITKAVNHDVSPATQYLNAGPANWGSLNGPTTTNQTGIPCPVTVNGGAWCQGQALGQMERNTLVGPGYFDTDLGFAKAFRITEGSRLKFEANFFNIFNHPNFAAPDSNLNDGNFGRSTSTFNNQSSGGPRITQLALRFEF